MMKTFILICLLFSNIFPSFNSRSINELKLLQPYFLAGTYDENNPLTIPGAALVNVNLDDFTKSRTVLFLNFISGSDLLVIVKSSYRKIMDIGYCHKFRSGLFDKRSDGKVYYRGKYYYLSCIEEYEKQMLLKKGTSLFEMEVLKKRTKGDYKFNITSLLLPLYSVNEDGSCPLLELKKVSFSNSTGKFCAHYFDKEVLRQYGVTYIEDDKHILEGNETTCYSWQVAVCSLLLLMVLLIILFLLRLFRNKITGKKNTNGNMEDNGRQFAEPVDHRLEINPLRSNADRNSSSI